MVELVKKQCNHSRTQSNYIKIFVLQGGETSASVRPLKLTFILDRELDSFLDDDHEDEENERSQANQTQRTVTWFFFYHCAFLLQKRSAETTRVATAFNIFYMQRRGCIYIGIPYLLEQLFKLSQTMNQQQQVILIMCVYLKANH